MSPVYPDPEAYPWAGIAVHGNTPFSCVLISHIVGNLWVGGCIDGLKLADDFRFVVSLYPWEQYRLGPDTERLEVRLYDDAIDSIGEIHDIAQTAFECVAAGKTLIHCQAGLNRSGLISTLVLIKQGYTVEDALALLREKRTPAVVCNPYYQEFLASL